MIENNPKVTEISQFIQRDLHLWWIAVLIILALTTTLVGVHAPQLIGGSKKDIVFQLKTYLSGLSLLILLFCIYALLSGVRFGKLRSQLLLKEVENVEIQFLLGKVEERSRDLLKTKEELEKMVSEHTLAKEKLVYLASHDSLTQLPNRTLLMDRLNQLLTRLPWSKRLAAVLFLDLDNFKHINDTMGHQTGDHLLIAVSERLHSCLREGDTIARMGGDEFAIVLSDIARAEDVTKVAQKIIDAMAKKFIIKDRDFFITTSVGVSLYPSDGENAETLLKNADTAMYRAKGQGRNNFQLYSATMNANAFEHLTMEIRLRQALEQKEFELHYQPLIDLNTKQIAGVEALIRWQHPDLGIVYPSKFIPLAEETGLIDSIGEWTMRTACAQYKAWKDSGISPTVISVNMSVRQFQQRNLVRMIRQVLNETGVDANCLQLELTESVMMQKDESFVAMLAELSSMGTTLSIDDFGIGYSSLRYLKRFPVTTLKIDQSFVNNITKSPDDMAIVTAIITLAHSLHLKAVAEGVETKEQLDLLRSLHCDGIQGYLFSRPLPADQATKFLAEENRL